MKVLIVDDCADSAFLLTALLKGKGYEAEQAHDARAALDVASRWRPDAVFVDIALGKESGYVVARRLRSEVGLADALIVALSGYADDEERRIESGIDAHLLKPASLKGLCNILANWQSTEPTAIANGV